MYHVRNYAALSKEIKKYLYDGRVIFSQDRDMYWESRAVDVVQLKNVLPLASIAPLIFFMINHPMQQLASDRIVQSLT